MEAWTFLGLEDFSAAQPNLECGWVLELRSSVAVGLPLDGASCRLQGLCQERALPRTSASDLPLPGPCTQAGASRLWSQVPSRWLPEPEHPPSLHPLGFSGKHICTTQNPFLQIT